MKLMRFVATLGIGAIAGMLLAPKKGSELRKELVEKGKDTVDTAKNMSKEDYIALMNKTIDDVKKAIDEFDVDDFKDATKNKYDGVKNNFNELKDKLEDVTGKLKDSEKYAAVKDKLDVVIAEIADKIDVLKEKISEQSYDVISELEDEIDDIEDELDVVIEDLRN